MDLRRRSTPHGVCGVSRVERLDGLYLGGINDRAFLVSPDAVMLDSICARSDAASELLGADGPAARPAYEHPCRIRRIRTG